MLDFLTSQPPVGRAEIVRASIGGGLGIAITAAVSSAWLGAPGAAPLLIAPMGASTVLLFAVPASPLAQPYALLGGNLIAALVGVTAAQLIASPFAAAALAVPLAMALMALCRCVHPPSGAVALTAVLGGAQVHAAGYGFVAVPVLLNSILLVLVALAYHRLTGRSYPHHAHPAAHPAVPRERIRLTEADYEAAIADYGERLAIGADDLKQLFAALLARNEPSRPD